MNTVELVISEQELTALHDNFKNTPYSPLVEVIRHHLSHNAAAPVYELLTAITRAQQQRESEEVAVLAPTALMEIHSSPTGGWDNTRIDAMKGVFGVHARNATLEVLQPQRADEEIMSRCIDLDARKCMGPDGLFTGTDDQVNLVYVRANPTVIPKIYVLQTFSIPDLAKQSDLLCRERLARVPQGAIDKLKLSFSDTLDVPGIILRTGPLFFRGSGVTQVAPSR